jgi:DNA mismatch repair protein MutS2
MLPDLLEPTPRARLDLGRIERAMDFAFASGGTFTELDDCLDRAAPLPSPWDPTCFERGLFVRELVTQWFKVQIDGAPQDVSVKHLVEVLTRPPRDLAITRFRQAILRELAATAALRRDLEKTYVLVRRFRDLLGPKDASELAAPERRRMDVLRTARALVDELATGFEGATSGLSRLRELGKSIQDGDGYKNVVHLLELDRSLAAIDVRLRVGADGTLRAIEMVSIRESDGNPLYVPPVKRFWQRVVRWFRGYVLREPEVRDALVDQVFTGIRKQLAPVFQLMGDLEIYLAALGFRDAAKKQGLDVCLPEMAETPPPGTHAPRALEALFNPHLLGEGRAPTPCSLAFERHDAIAIFTGPNSGGKTRLLQAFALTQMLGQAGVFVPAARASLVAAEGMFVSLVEEARPDQREGRLGTELLRIRDVFERLRPGGAVLLDELCSGTNPGEGTEIFELVISLLGELAPQALITTHFLDFAARLADESTDGRLTFLQTELDAASEPTYQFVPGVARSSLARKTAERLGVTREALLELVEKARAGRLAVLFSSARPRVEDSAEIKHP